MLVNEQAVQAAFEAYGDRYRSIAAMQDALTAALPFLTGVKVKELEWVEIPACNGLNTAKTRFGNYTIGSSLVVRYGLKSISKPLATLEAAKAAAQADYEARFWSMAEVSARDCACTKIQQDESCPVGYPSLLCEICDGKGVATSPRAQALEEAAQVAEQFRNNDWIAHDMRTGVFPKQSEPGVAIAAAIRALSSQPVADRLPQDVINLVIAAREAWETWQLPEEEFKRLDTALEAFASRVPYENEPKD